jgi:hypothetical protein
VIGCRTSASDRSHQPLTTAQTASWERATSIASKYLRRDVQCAASGQVPSPRKINLRFIKLFQPRSRSLWQAQEEIAMGHPLRTSRRAVAAAFLQALMSAPIALASQGPGGGPGTASPSTQLVMAIVVYGGAASILAAGLIRLLKRRF